MEFYLDAYGESIGTWFWIIVHAIGCAVSARLFASRNRTLAILFAVAWGLAITFLLVNVDERVHDLLR